MYKQIFLHLLLFSSCVLFSQSSDKVEVLLAAPDTVYVYDCKYTILQSGGSITYTINGQAASAEEFAKLDKGFKQRQGCNPCYLIEKSIEERVKAEGMYYHKCPGKESSKEANRVIDEANYRESFVIKGTGCKVGLWLFYDSEGNLEGKEHFEEPDKKK